MARVAARLLARLLALLAVAVLAILGLEQILTRRLPLEDMVESYAAELGRPVEVDAMQVRLLPVPRAHFEGVRIEPDATIARVDVELGIRSFLHGGLEGGRALFQGVALTLRRRADGSFAFGGRKGDEEPAADAASGGPLPLPALPRLELHDVVLRFEDEAAAGGAHTTTAFLQRVAIRTRREADTATVEASGLLGARPGPETFQARFQLEPAAPGRRRAWKLEVRTAGIDPHGIVPHLPTKWGFRSARGRLDALVDVARDEADVETGRLDLAFSPGSVDYAGLALEGRIAFRGPLRDEEGFQLPGARAEVDRLVLGPLDARKLRARLRYGQGRLVFDELDFETWGGRIQAQLSVEPGAKPVTFETTVEAGGLALSQLPRVSPETTPAPSPREEETFVDASGRFHGHWVQGREWMSGIEGDGTVSMRGGSLPAGKVLASAFRKLLSPAGADGGSRATTRLRTLRADFTMEDGRARTSDLHLETDDYRVEGRGSVGPLGDLDLEGEIFFAAAVMRWLTLAGSDERASGYPGLPFALRGRLGDPRTEFRLTQGARATAVLLPRAVGELTESTAAPLGLGVEGALKLFRRTADDEDEPASPTDAPAAPADDLP